MTELWCEKFEWFDPSPVEPVNLGLLGRAALRPPRGGRRDGAGAGGAAGHRRPRRPVQGVRRRGGREGYGSPAKKWHTQ